MRNRLTNSTVGAIQNIAFNSTVEANTHFNTIFESTWHHNWHLSSLAKCRHHMGCTRLATSVPDIGLHELDFWNSIQKNMITILIHILQLSALYRNTGLSNCILGMGNLTGYVHVPVKYESFWKRISINTILTFVLLVGTFGVMVKRANFA